MIRQGMQPVLAGSSEEDLAELAENLEADLPKGRRIPIATADASSAEAVGGLLRSSGDVLVSTVGSYTSHGDIPVRAAIASGCGYVDCAWEPPFIQRVFSGLSPSAAAHGAVLLPAFGSYYVAGSLAATIAVRRAMTGSRPPGRVDIGYFTLGGRGGAPGEALIDSAFRWSDGRMTTERPGLRVRTFDIGGGKHSDALSFGTAEHFTVPRLAASVTEVNVYVGWFGRLTRAASVAGAVGSTARAMPGLGTVWDSMVRGIGSNGAPAVARGHTDDRSRTLVVAETYDADGAFQHRVRVEGPDPRELTASLLSWGAGMLLQGAETGVGVLGPAEAFGTEALISGCMALGLSEIHHEH